MAPQAPGLWNAEHLKTIQKIIKGLASADRDRIDILGHSMGDMAPISSSRSNPIILPPQRRRPEDDGGFYRSGKDQVYSDLGVSWRPGRRLPIAQDQKTFDQMKQLDGTMKFTTWADAKHALSDKSIPESDNGTT